MPRGRQFGSHNKPKDPAAQVPPEVAAAADKPPEKEPRKRSHQAAPKVTEQLAEGVIDAVQSLGLLIGHMPADVDAEKKAATAGLLAACRKSPLVRSLVLGGVNAGDYGVIVVGLGGLFGRIGLDVAAQVRPESEQIKAARQQVYAGTGLVYQLFAGQWPDGTTEAPEVPSPAPAPSNGTAEDLTGAVLAPMG